MKILLFFIIIFYNISAFSFSKKDAIYQEGGPLFEELTISAGYHLAWIECSSAGDGQKVSQEIKKLVAKLSWPDFKIFNNSAAAAANNPPKFVGFFCNSGLNKFKEVESLLYNYVEELKFKIENINSTIAETKNEQEYTSEDILKININEDLNQINIKELTKIKNIEIEKIINGNASLGYYISGEIFESIYYPSTPGEKGDFKFINRSGQYKGKYKIATSKICYLMEGEDKWSCGVMFKKNKNIEEFYLANKGKIYAKIVSVMKIPEYEKMKFENSAAEKARIAEEKRIAE